MPVLLAIEALDEPSTRAAVDAWPNFKDPFDDGCVAAMDCTRRYRITAVLADPSAITEPIEVSWAASAENRVVGGDGPADPPAGATLTLTADEPVAGPADRLVIAGLPRDERRLDARHPRFVQTVALSQPEGAGVEREMLFGTLLWFTVAADDPDRVFRGEELQVEDADGNRLSSGITSGTGIVRVPACVDPGGCRTELRIVGEWLGGTSTAGATVTWSLATIAFGAGANPANPPAGAITVEAHPVTAATVEPAGEIAGEFDVGGRSPTRRIVTVNIDPRDLGEFREGRVFVQATLTAVTTSRFDADQPVRVSVGEGAASGPAGSDLTAVSGAMPVDCSNGPCQVSFQIDSTADGSPESDVHVAWTLSIALLAERPSSVDPGTRPEITVRNPPGP